MTKNNIVGTLLRTLQDHGFTLEDVEGFGLVGTPRRRRMQAKAEIVSRLDALLMVRSPAGRMLWLCVVPGNELPYIVPTHMPDPDLVKALTEYQKYATHTVNLR